ncbi:hypothetical protein GGI02_004882 [Coemansia sp. RSA 2322]|nr:hypothetical protein GGI02_004882 [Coemansia sp. RSA 2322]
MGAFDGRLALREALHTGLAWGVLAVVTVWMVLCQEWSDMRWVRAQAGGHGRHGGARDGARDGVLYDVVLAQLPFVRETWVSDAVVNTAGLACVLGCLWQARGWQARAVLVRRVGWMMAALYLLRSFTLSITTLPPSVANCAPVVAADRAGLVALIPGLISGRLSACTDKVFSGHTTILVISLLFWRRYARHWGFIAYSAVHTAAGIASVLLVRLHYSVDVLLAVVLTCAVHHAYYRALEAAVRARRIAARHAHRRNRSLLADDAAYARVPASDDDAQTPPPDALARLFGRRASHRRDNSVAAADAAADADADAATLANNSPQPDAAHIDLEKAAAAPESLYYASAAGLPYAVDAADSMDLLAINRPLGSALPILVAWMDGLHLR